MDPNYWHINVHFNVDAGQGASLYSLSSVILHHNWLVIVCDIKTWHYQRDLLEQQILETLKQKAPDWRAEGWRKQLPAGVLFPKTAPESVYRPGIKVWVKHWPLRNKSSTFRHKCGPAINKVLTLSCFLSLFVSFDTSWSALTSVFEPDSTLLAVSSQ